MSLGASPSFDSMSNFPGGFAQGLQVQGMPILNSYPGRVFWLDSQNGSDNNRGTFARPFASLMGAQAVLQAQAPTIWNDILMVKPGHRETISAPRTAVTTAASMSLDLSGLTVIGMGVGQDRPTFTLDTSANAVINVTSSNITLQNLRFVANFANIVALFHIGGSTGATGIASFTGVIAGNVLTATSVTGTLYAGSTLSTATSGFVPGTKIVSQVSGTAGGAGTYIVNVSQTVASGSMTTVARSFNLRNCDVNDNSAVLNFLTIVKTGSATNASDGLTIFGNTITSKSAAGVVNLLAANGTNDRISIANNFYSALSTDTGAAIPIATGKSLTNLIVADNTFSLTGATGTTTGILLSTDQTSNTGVVCRNFAQSLDATTEILATASSGFRFFENYYSGTADKSGYLLPAADA